MKKKKKNGKKKSKNPLNFGVDLNKSADAGPITTQRLLAGYLHSHIEPDAYST